MAPRKTLFVLAGVFLAASALLAQQKALKVNVELVMVNATVTDSANRLITDLDADHFQLFEDKVEQKIRYFSSEVAPVSLGIVFDISHSMERKLSFARDAAVKFLETGTPQDEYFLVEFASRANITEGFTTDIDRLRD